MGSNQTTHTLSSKQTVNVNASTNGQLPSATTNATCYNSNAARSSYYLPPTLVFLSKQQEPSDNLLRLQVSLVPHAMLSAITASRCPRYNPNPTYVDW